MLIVNLIEREMALNSEKIELLIDRISRSDSRSFSSTVNQLFGYLEKEVKDNEVFEKYVAEREKWKNWPAEDISSFGNWHLPDDFEETKSLSYDIYKSVAEQKDNGDKLSFGLFRQGRLSDNVDRLNQTFLEYFIEAIKEIVNDNQGTVIEPIDNPIISMDDEDFVHCERIQELEDLKSKEYDLSKLIMMCKELNSNYHNRNYFSVAMLGRSILDHIPPIFGFNSFNEVCNNYGSRSFKKNMEHLNNSMRSIADINLHQVIRKKEPLPNKVQIDFKSGLDLLLSEIIIILNS